MTQRLRAGLKSIAQKAAVVNSEPTARKYGALSSIALITLFTRRELRYAEELRRRKNIQRHSEL